VDAAKDGETRNEPMVGKLHQTARQSALELMRAVDNSIANVILQNKYKSR
jgi:hypothetical protein